MENNFWRLGVTDKIFSTLVALSRRSQNTRKFTATKVENNFLHYAEAPEIIFHLSCNVEKVEKWRSVFQNLPRLARLVFGTGEPGLQRSRAPSAARIGTGEALATAGPLKPGSRQGVLPLARLWPGHAARGPALPKNPF